MTVLTGPGRRRQTVSVEFDCSGLSCSASGAVATRPARDHFLSSSATSAIAKAT